MPRPCLSDHSPHTECRLASARGMAASVRHAAILALMLALAAVPGLRADITRAPAPVPRIERGLELDLSLRDAIEMALRQNLQIRVERYAIEASGHRIDAARGWYDPVVGVVSAADSSTSPTTSVLQGSGAETSTGRRLIPTFHVNLPFGGRLSSSFSTAKTSTSSPVSLVNPLYASGLDMRLEQPLLRGSFRNATRNQLRILNLDSKISAAQFRQTVSEVVRNVQSQYWNLVYAREAFAARRESRELALGQAAQIEQKVAAGLLTPVALTSARAEVAIRDQEVIQAEVQIVAAENNLKRLLAGNPTAEIWRRRISPTDQPQLRSAPGSLDEAMEKALRNRPELETLDLRLRGNRLQRQLLRWETLPQLNLTGSYGTVGAAGEVFAPIYDPDGGVVPIGRIPLTDHPAYGNYRTAWDQIFDRVYPIWSVGLSLEVPLLNRASRARLAEATIEWRRLETGMNSQRQAIMVEVANAWEGVELQRRAVEVARLARELSQEQVRGEMARFEAGFTTHFEVVRYQRDLDEARVRELRAMVEYEIALASLNGAMDTIVDQHELDLAMSNR